MTENSRSNSPQRAIICLGSAEIEPARLLFSGVVSRLLSLYPVLACVRPKRETDDECRQRIHQATGHLGFASVGELILKGSPERAILRHLDQENYQLLVLGASPCAPGSIMHRVKQRLALKAKVNVLVVNDPPKKIERILVCTGGHKLSETAVLTSLDMAAASRSQLTILHIATASPSMYAGLNAQDESLEQVLSRQHPLSDHLRQMAALAAKRGIEAKLELRHGMVIEEILRASEMTPYDLIVMGTPPPKAILSRLLLGRVYPPLITSTELSILIVRNPLDS